MKESNIKEHIDDDQENIGDRVKEVTDDGFLCVTQQQEEINRNMKEQIVELCHMLETIRIAPLQ
jgi:hypothetical protein